MKLIELYNQRGYAFVDDEDYERVKSFGNWQLGTQGYACFMRHGNHYYIHYVVLPRKEGFAIDHIDGDKLNNQKSNLRYCTLSQNQANRVLNKNNTSGYKGVTLHETGKWSARVNINKKRRQLGLFETPKDAALAYNKAMKEHFGDFAKLNNV